ncbi:MAG TPA: hypothetical protein VH497_19390 [Vicinamibacterales bacterium]
MPGTKIAARVALTTAIALLAAGASEAQPLGRLTGKVWSEAGTGVESANIRIEALYGFLGGDYAGQKTFDLRTNSKGDWALIGFKAGIWVFEASAPGRLPDVIALPFNVSVAPSSGVGGEVPSWHPILRLATVPATPTGEVLARAAEAALAGRSQAVAAELVRIADSNDEETLTAAGRICLVLRDPSTARPFFRRALERNPQSFGAAMGLATTALMQKDFDSAGKAYGDARDRTTDKGERSCLTAAIGDVNKVHVRLRGY